MTSTARIGAAQIHVVLTSAMAIAADATRELQSAPPAAAKSRDEMMEWLKITVVPLGVLLMGACLWGCIKSSVCWRTLSELITHGRRGVSIVPEADATQLAARLPNTSSQHGSDVEEGNAAPHHGIGDELGIATSAGEMMQQLALQSTNQDGGLPVL